jgi:hypothetical protein
MPVTKNELANGPIHIEIGSYKCETVCSFTYLGSEVNCKNDISDEIKGVNWRQINVSMALGNT